MNFTEEQKNAYNIFMNKNNLFITGAGGCGKSYFIHKIYENFPNKSIIKVCAMTGCASLLLKCNATTLHKWAGIGLGNGTIEENVVKIKYNNFKSKAWKETEILILDEVSMLSDYLFEMLDRIGKEVRGNDEPFGGIQLLFSGDFYQLPPVSKKNKGKYCFESKIWKETFPYCIEFMKIFRQVDERYIEILNNIRHGKINKSDCDILMERVNKVKENNNITKIFPTRKKVDEINIKEMELLGNIDEYVYEIEFLYDIKDDKKMTKELVKIKENMSTEYQKIELEYMKNGLICDSKIILKKGAYVMCVVNKSVIGVDKRTGCAVEKVLCNGSCGIITRFERYPVILFDNVEILMKPHVWQNDRYPWLGVMQVPLILAWAITIHKSQGISLENAEIDAGSDNFEYGQIYVALSRVKSLEGLYLTGFDVSKIRISTKVVNFYEKISSKKISAEKTDYIDNEDIPIAIPVMDIYHVS
uniref:DNA helicase Pif1-like DEAD-box helicase domain-containing protein n=1 Tax=viral metagenome TaxID=1070528 RepID=A0A6C0H5T0_9ZZZZ